ncbi:unnamed protein product [Protopolystoma xenopodis]|uniref:Uncharacterized protein n=1 Tax=Protopolystoma xenopodis TaxID=117903 RepID=A0A3S5FEL8_9PLAT|nr:unnamed protein product [Protopolystoma xenopodis]
MLTITKYGICGAYYYGIAVTTMVIFFSIFTLQMRLRAPGATTYLQVIRARFGPLPHLLYCTIALLNSTIVLALLMLGRLETRAHDGSRLFHAVGPRTRALDMFEVS